MKFWIGSDIRLPVRQLTQIDLSLFDLNPEGGVAMTTLQQDAAAQAGIGGFIYEAEVMPSAVLQRNHKTSTVANYYAPLQRLIYGAPDFKSVMQRRYRNDQKALMKDMIARGMLGAALDFVYAEFYVSKRRQFASDVVTHLMFDGRFAKVDATNLGLLSPDHPEHVEGLPEVQIKLKKVFATIWNLGCVRTLNETQLNA